MRRPAPAVGPLHEQQAIPLVDNDGDLFNMRDIDRFGAERDFVLPALQFRLANRSERTVAAARPGRGADQGAELHHRLIEFADRFYGQQRFRVLPKPPLHRRFPGILGNAEQPAQHALAVRLDDRQSAVIRLRKDGVGGVAAEARQGTDQLRVVGDGGMGGLMQNSSRLPQASGPAVIAQPFPLTQHVLLVGLGQMGERWEAMEKAFEMRDDGGDLGLLKHDLADPDAIRVAIEPPGKRPGVLAEPG